MKSMFSRVSRAALLTALSFCSLATIPAAFAAQPAPYVCTSAYAGGTAAAASVTTVSITCPGAVLGDTVAVGSSVAYPTNVSVTAFVSAANTIEVAITNPTAAGITVAAMTFTVVGTHRYVPITYTN